MNQMNDFYLGWVLEPLQAGDYPEVMKTQIGKRLPKIDFEIKRKSDFIAIDHNRVAVVGGYKSDNDGNDTTIGLLNQESVFEQDSNIWSFYDWRWIPTGDSEERFY